MEINRRSAKYKDTLSSLEDSRGYVYAAGSGDHQLWTIHLPDGNEEVREGFLNLNEICKSSKWGKPSLCLNFNRTSLFRKSSSTTLDYTSDYVKLLLFWVYFNIQDVSSCHIGQN